MKRERMVDAVIRKVGVVVPARDEETVIGRCLEAMTRAARYAPVPVEVIVVLDDCRDNTERVCQTFPTRLVSVCARSVGIARRAGVDQLLSGCEDPAAIWIASTDADSVVPHDWLRNQLELARTGVDVVVGTVRLIDDTHKLGSVFEEAYADGLGPHHQHAHVHGANLGFRASAYVKAGGFPRAAVNEDRILLDRLEGSGALVVRSSRIEVETSARLDGRCHGGFASTLRRLRPAS